MPRLREPVRVAHGELPVELACMDDSAWSTVGAALEWFRMQGLEGDLEVLERGPASRHRAAVEAWAYAHDWVHPWCVTNPRLVPDWARLRDAGVGANVSLVMMERLQAAGVRVD